MIGFVGTLWFLIIMRVMVFVVEREMMAVVFTALKESSKCTYQGEGGVAVYGCIHGDRVLKSGK